MKIKNLIIGFVLIISIIQLVSAEDYIHVNAGDGLFLPGEKISLDVCGTVPEVEIFVDEMPSTYVTDGLFGKVNPKGYKPTANVEKFKVNLEELEKNCYNRSNGEVYCNLNCKPLYVNISATGPGIYRIYARSGDLQGNNDFTVSRLGLITKRSNDKLLVYAVDLADGNPIKNLSVFFYNDSCSSNEKTTFLYSKKTDERGLIITDINETINETEVLLIMAKYNGNFDFENIYYFNEYNKKVYGNYYDKSKIYIYTDRPVYRPDQQVNFKAVLWERNDSGYSITDKEINIEIKDPKGNIIYNKNHSVTEFGSTSGNISLADEPPLGVYSIYVKVNGTEKGRGSFNVEEYRKPEYSVTLTPEKQSYINGDNATINLNANYYFGSPVALAGVEYNIYCYEGNQKSGNLTTDQSGNAKIEFETNVTGDSICFIDAAVVDKSRREISASAKVYVYTEFNFDIITDKWGYNKNEEVKIKVNSIDIDKNPVFVSANISIYKTWRSDRKLNTELVYEKFIETNYNKSSVIEFNPVDEGEYMIVATGRDSKNITIRSETRFYVSEQVEEYKEENSLELMLDKEKYNVSDTAQLTINSPVEDFVIV